MHRSRRDILQSMGTGLLTLSISSTLARGAPGPRGRDAAEFLRAVEEGRLAVVKAALLGDATLARAKDVVGRSAYVLANLRGHPEVAALLLETGLELDMVEAVFAEDWPRFDALAKADPELLNRVHPVGGTPLYAGALVGNTELWRLRYVGSDSNARPAGGTGFTPARGAMESPHAAWALVGGTDVLSNGGDPNAAQRGGDSVLHGAVRQRDPRVLRMVVRKGARVDAVDDAGRTPEQLARELGWEVGVELLAAHALLPRDNRSSRFSLDANGDPVSRPDLSDVPQELQSEVTSNSHGRLARVQELVGKDERLVFSISTEDELAIEACAHTGNRPLIQFHLDHGAPLSLPTAVGLGDHEAIDRWLDLDATLSDERGAHDFPVMLYAFLGRSIEVAEHLYERGVSLDQESMGSTTLHWCAQRGASEFAEWLLENGADPEPVGHRWNRAGETPLQVALAGGHAAVAQLLRKHGARG